MQEYQKKVGRKHKITPRSKRTRSQCKLTVGSVPSNEVNNMAENDSTDDLSALPPMERLEKMMGNMCRKLTEVQGQMYNMQADIAEIKLKQTEHYDDLTGKLAECQKENAQLKTHLSAAVDRIDTLEQCYKKSYSLREEDKKIQRANNIIIRGVPEVRNEKLFETMGELIAPLEGELLYTQTNGAVRMGKGLSNPHGNDARQGRHRPIKLYCATRLQKGVLFRGLQDIRKIPKFANVTMSNDLDNDRMMVRKEVFVLYMAVKKIQGVQTSVKGEMIEIDGNKYGKDQFQNLPHGISLEKASTVETPNGVAFQGHGSPASSLYRCDIDDGQHIFNCVEQQFVYYKAVECMDYVASADVLCENNPYTILEIGKAIKTTKEWEDCEVNVLKTCHRYKLTQNPRIRKKLQSLNKDKYYEATFNRVYGAGFNLDNAAVGTANPPKGYRNELGKIIVELLDELKEAE